MRRPQIVIPTILGLLVVLGGLTAGLWLTKNFPNFGTFASDEDVPINLRITNISDSSLVVSWITSRSTSGFVKYSEDYLTAPELVVSDDRDQERGSVENYFSHFVSVRGLKASTKYKIKIGSGKSLGLEQIISTGPILRNPPPADVIYGQITTQGGDPADGALVYIQISGVVPQATLVKSSGSWVVPLSVARTTDLTSFAPYDKQSSRAEIFVQAGSLGTAFVTVPLADARPVFPIILGQSSFQSSVPAPTPETTPVSKFTESSLDVSVNTQESKIKLNSIKPVVTGVAPSNTVLKIEVNSNNQIQATIKTDKTGKFSYKIPEGLEPGEHTITVSTVVDGVVQKITKSFIVEAAAGATTIPSFTATPSAKLKPSPSPIPRVAYPAQTDQPKSGSFDFSLLLLIFGAILIFAGLYSFKNLYIKNG